MKSRELSLFLESLRKKRNIEMSDFCLNIVSVRQYKRYLVGDSDMPYSTFVALSEKLGFNPVQIQVDLDERRQKMNTLIDDFYNLVVGHDFEKATEKMKEIDVDNYLTEENEMYFKVTKQLLRFYQNKDEKEEVKNEIYRLIDYPNILKKDLYDNIELLVLSLLFTFMEKEEKPVLVQKLHEQLMLDKMTVGNEFYSRQYVTIRLAREHGILKDNDKVIELCLKGLENAERPKIFFNFDFFYYFLALACRNKEDHEKAKYYVKRLYLFLLFEDNPKRLDNYKTKIIKDFGYGFEVFGELN